MKSLEVWYGGVSSGFLGTRTSTGTTYTLQPGEAFTWMEFLRRGLGGQICREHESAGASRTTSHGFWDKERTSYLITDTEKSSGRTLVSHIRR
jgi:hypothetical protein